VTNADTWPNGLRRVELGYTPPRATYEGSERYYAFSLRQSDDLPLDPAISNAVAYWEAYPIYQQSMAFNVTGANIRFDLRLPTPGAMSGSTAYTGSFAAGRWHDFVLHVRWSADPAVGFVELWHNGARVVARTSVKTMVTSTADGGTTVYPAFFHIGLLHGNFDHAPQAVLVDRVLEGSTYDDVAIALGSDGATSSDAASDAAADAAADGAADADSPREDANGDGPSNDAATTLDAANATPDVMAAGDASMRDDGAASAGCSCRAAANERATARWAVLATLCAAIAASGRRRRYTIAGSGARARNRYAASQSRSQYSGSVSSNSRTAITPRVSRLLSSIEGLR
jgi:hypothetical protein